MIGRFPHQEALLDRTRLRYVDLPGILNDGKVDRSSRIPAIVAIFYGSETDLLFLREGEAVTAACVRPEERRPVAIADVVDRAEAAREHAEVGFYRTSPGQLGVIWAATSSSPVLDAEDRRFDGPGDLFSWVRRQSFDGVLEILSGPAANYVLFAAGTPTDSYLTEDTGEGSVEERLANVLHGDVAEGMGAPRVTGYPAVGEIPVQAPPALFTLYRGLFTRTLEVLGSELGVDEARTCFIDALERQRPDHPILTTFDPRASGDAIEVAETEELTDAALTLFVEVLSTCGPEGATDLRDPHAGRVSRIIADQRYALQAQGFLERLPWSLPFDGA